VARINPVKLKQDADKEERAGRLEKAVDLLKQIVQENPRDWATINRIGDLYVKANNIKAANEQFAKVADFYARDGFYLKAIAVWKKINRNDPSLLEAHLNLGDLYGKQGLAAEAKAAFNLAYDEYVKRGKLREAGDVLRRLAELDPSDMPSRIRLAGLYAREGRQDKAAEEYAAIAEELVNKGHRQEALQLLNEGLKMGRRTPRLLSEIARVHLVQKDFKSALPYLEEARRGSPDDRDVSLRTAEAYLGVQRAEEARRVLEDLLRRHGDDQDARVLLGRVLHATGQPDEAFEQLRTAVDQLVERRQVDRAVALLQPVSQQEPAHIPTLAKLVELYRLSRNEAMVVQTYSQMVEAYLRQGEMEKAGSILELLVQLEPHNEQHRTKLDWIRKQGVEPAPASWLPELSQSRVAPAAPAARPAAGPAIELSGPLGPEDQEFVDEHLSEGRVFRKYGLVDKARDQFEAIIGRFPDNLEARRELASVHKERNELEKVAIHQRAIAQILRLTGDTAGAEEAEALAREAAPEAAAEPPAAEAPPPVAAAPPDEPALLEPEMPELTPEPEPEVDLSAMAESAAAAEAEAPELELLDLPEEPPEPEAPPEQQFFDEHDLGEQPGEIRTEFLEGEAPSAPEPEPDFDLSEISAESAQGQGLVPQAGPAAAPLGDVPADLQRKLEDVEQYVSLGFVEDAQASLAELGGRYADHPALLRKLEELGLDLAAPGSPAASEAEPLAGLAEPARAAGEEEPLQLGENFLDFTPPPSPAAPPPAEPGTSPDLGGGTEPGFDLASELGGLFGAQPAVAPAGADLEGTDLGDDSLTDIFREFQKGVDKQLGKEDFETRYNLGIAYKEMGLVDEAIAEFQLAAKDESRLLECASMLGICFLEKGMPKLAVKWFEKGLQARGRTEAEYQGLRYDLAHALEASGETHRALEMFTELYGQNARFRDVEDRVRQLSASR
jgi:tetratricopeptide (TPR) repeat protein